MNLRQLFSTLSLSLLLACSSSHMLTVQTRSLDSGFYASAQAGTPTRVDAASVRGEQLLVEWSIPAQDWKAHNGGFEIQLRLRYGDKTEELKTITLESRSGHKTYTLLNGEYYAKKGYETYLGELVATDGEVVDSWQHQVWTDYLRIGPDSAEGIQVAEKESSTPQQ